MATLKQITRDALRVLTFREPSREVAVSWQAYLLFGLVVTWVAVFQGYDCEPTSEGISRATTRTVVYASLAVLGLDFILTALMFGDF